MAIAYNLANAVTDAADEPARRARRVRFHAAQISSARSLSPLSYRTHLFEYARKDDPGIVIASRIALRWLVWAPKSARAAASLADLPRA